MCMMCVSDGRITDWENWCFVYHINSGWVWASIVLCLFVCFVLLDCLVLLVCVFFFMLFSCFRDNVAWAWRGWGWGVGHWRDIVTCCVEAVSMDRWEDCKWHVSPASCDGCLSSVRLPVVYRLSDYRPAWPCPSLWQQGVPVQLKALSTAPSRAGVVGIAEGLYTPHKMYSPLLWSLKPLGSSLVIIFFFIFCLLFPVSAFRLASPSVAFLIVLFSQNHHPQLKCNYPFEAKQLNTKQIANVMIKPQCCPEHR